MKSRANRILISALVALCLSACRMPVQRSPLTFSGTLEVTEHALSLPVPSRLEEVLVDEGSAVQKGAILAFSDRHSQAKKDYERLANLYRAGGTDKQSLEHAELAAKDQRIESPVDGEVLVKVRQTGETLAAGAPVLIVGETGRPWVRLYVPEGSVQKIKLGQKARIRLDGTKKDLAGEVSYISPKAEFTPRNVQTVEERVTQTFLVKVRLTENPRSAHPGVFAEVRIETPA